MSKYVDDLIAARIYRRSHGSRNFLVYAVPPMKLCPVANADFWSGWVAEEGTSNWIGIGAYHSDEAALLRVAQENIEMAFGSR